jgi:preprotein translocase subunit SecE
MEKLGKFFDKIKKYLLNVKTELKRVSWPSKKELYASTIIVLITLFSITLYMWLCDNIYIRIFERLGY